MKREELLKNSAFKKTAWIIFSLDFLVIAIAVSRAIILQRSPMRYFGENGFITWFSVLQLLMIAGLSWRIGTIRKRHFSMLNLSPRKNVIFWKITALGMFFFALDEGFTIHENLDRLIHQLMQRKITDFSSRLDDVIILLYVITGLLIVYLFKKELTQFSAAISWFIWGLCFSLSTIFLDMLSHNRATFTPLADNLQELNNIHHWFSALEEMPKILAEGAFLVGCYGCLQIAQKKYRETLNTFNLKTSSKYRIHNR